MNLVLVDWPSRAFGNMLWVIGSIIWGGIFGVTLFLRLCGRLGLPRLASVIGAIWVAIHPVQSEVVFFVSARNDSMAAAWILGAVLCLIPAEGRAGSVRLLGGGLCTLGAALCKESVLLAPLVFLALSKWRRQRWDVAGCLAMVAGLLVYFGLRSAAGVGWPEGASLTATIQQSPSILAYYSRDLLQPWDVGPGCIAFGPACSLVHVGFGEWVLAFHDHSLGSRGFAFSDNIRHPDASSVAGCAGDTSARSTLPLFAHDGLGSHHCGGVAA